MVGEGIVDELEALEDEDEESLESLEALLDDSLIGIVGLWPRTIV
jgi:hypothetical protein